MQENLCPLPCFEYFERIMCNNYYHNGELIRPDRPIEIIMTGLSDLSMACITDHEFESEDIVLFDIKLESYPYDKLMGKVQCLQKVGYMYRMDLAFLGMPNSLFEKIKELCDDVGHHE